MSTEQNKATARELFARFTDSEIDGVMDLLTDDATWLIPGKPELFPTAGPYTKERIKRLFQYMLSQLPGGLKITVKSTIGEGDKVAVEAESYGELSNGRIYNQQYHFLWNFATGRFAPSGNILILNMPSPCGFNRLRWAISTHRTFPARTT